MPDQTADQRYIDRRMRQETDAWTRSNAIDAILRREVLLTQLAGSIGRRAAVQEAFSIAARNAMGLSHANIVATYDLDSMAGYPTVVQEFVQSESLRTIIDAEKPFHPDDVSILVSGLSDALAYARLRGLPHLALNPDRIIVDFDGTVLITDFGIGVVLDDLEPDNHRNAAYRAPERSAGGQGDARSDIYSVGVIAWEMLTGQSPQPDSAGRIPDATSVNPEVPPDVSAMVAMAVQPAPDDRFRSIEAFSSALEQWRDPEEPPPAPPGLPTLPLAIEETPQYRYLEPEPSPGIEPLAVDIAEDLPDEPDASTGRLTMVLAWCGFAIGILALGWVVFSFVSGDDDTPDVTRVADGDIVATSTVAVAVTAPDLVGQTVEQALASAQFPVTVGSSRVDASAPAGQILEQSPVAGDPVPAEGIVVVISTGPNANVLADLDLAGLTFEDLSTTLLTRGVNVVRQDEASSDVPEGAVIGIVESDAAPGDTVTVRVSMGDRVQIPLNLQSMPVDDVQAELEGLGLVVNEPIAVSFQRIQDAGVDLEAFSIVNGDVVGIQEDGAGFGEWVLPGSEVTPVYYDAALP